MNGNPYAQPHELATWERLRLSWALLRDERVSAWIKFTVPVIAMMYVILPVDLIPDFLFGLGQIDDVSIIGISLFAMTKVLPRLAPKPIVAEHLNRLRGVPREESTHRDEQDGTVIETTYTVVDDRSRDAGGNRFEQAWGNRA